MSSKKPTSLRARITRLDSRIPDDPDELCCLDGFKAWNEILVPHYATLGPYFDLDPGGPEPPSEPPELPLGGTCRRTGGELCTFACDLARLHWTRSRQLAISTAGLDESEL